MTYDPDRGQRAPEEITPNLRSHERVHIGPKINIGWLLALLVIAAFGVFLLFGLGEEEGRVVENPATPPAPTTGVSPAEEPARPTPSTPVPPPNE